MDDDDHDHHGNGNTPFSLALARSCGEVHLIGPACSLAQPSKAHWPTGSGRNRKPTSSSSKTKTSLSLARLAPPSSTPLSPPPPPHPHQPPTALPPSSPKVKKKLSRISHLETCSSLSIFCGFLHLILMHGVGQSLLRWI